MITTHRITVPWPDAGGAHSIFQPNAPTRVIPPLSKPAVVILCNRGTHTVVLGDATMTPSTAANRSVPQFALEVGEAINLRTAGPLFGLLQTRPFLGIGSTTLDVLTIT